MRQLPENLQAERSALGAVLIEPGMWRRIASELTADDFSAPQNREVFEAMGGVVSRGAVVDLVSLEDELSRRQGLERIPGGLGYLVACSSSVGSLELIPQAVRLIREKATARRAIAALGDAQAALFSGEQSAEVLETLARQVSALATGSASDLVRLGQVFPEALAEIERRGAAAGTGLPTGVRFGVEELDKLTGGLQPGDQCVIAAETAGGKTVLAVQAALTSVLVDGGTAILFNLEMTRRQLAERALCHLGKINSHLLRRGEVDMDGFRKLHDIAARTYEAPIYLEDRAFALRDITSKARAWRARHPAKRGLVVVDFVQLVRAEGVKGEGRVRELGRTAYALKELAKELDVSVITVSQIGRAAAKAGEPPTKLDLKESGDIENSADQIVLLWNPGHIDEGAVTCILDKNRHGMTASFNVGWIARHFAFTDALQGGGR